MPKPLLIVITGATASGKTQLAIDLARHLGTEIISADSRQIYRDLPIGTASPTQQQLNEVKHHLVGFLPLDAYYSAARFEEDALNLLPSIFSRCGDMAVAVGGSMMYIDALTDGIDPLPTITTEVRQKVLQLYQQHGIEGMLAMLEIADPQYYNIVDRSNAKRVIHALEIIMQSGATYTALRSGTSVKRPFNILKVAIDMPREILFSRINSRVEAMMATGLEEEAMRFFDRRHLNALNTVGYKEIYAMALGHMDRNTAIARIAKNTRVYAKKQITWLKRPSVRAAIPLNYEDALPTLLRLINDFKI